MTTSSDRAHAHATTERLRAEEPPLGLALNEAICPVCSLAYLVTDRAFDWGTCPDCIGAALEPVRR